MKKSRIAQRSSLALALEPRMMFDGAAVATAGEVASEAVGDAIMLTGASSTAPSGTADGVDGTCIIDVDGNIVSGDTLDIFDDVKIFPDADESDITEMVVTVGASGAEHALVFDGTEIALTATGGWNSTANNEFSYQVSVVDGNAVVTIKFYIDAGTVGEAIDGMHYKMLDPSAAESGSFNITLTSISDDSDTTVLDISATVTVDSARNVAPVLDLTDGYDLAGMFNSENLGTASEVSTYTVGGVEYLYAADTDGNLCVFSVGEDGTLTEIQSLKNVNDLSTVSGMALNAEVSTLYAIDGNNIVALTIGGDGKLTYKESIKIKDGDSLNAFAISASDDGKQLYVSCAYEGFFVINVDLTTGDLSNGQQLATDSANGVIATSVGNYVYAVGCGFPGIITVYERTDGGTLNKVTSILNDVNNYGASYNITASKDGSRFFVRSYYTGYDENYNTVGVYKIYAYFFDGTNIILTDTVDSVAANDFVTSTNGDVLYITTADGTLDVYSIDSNGSLKLTTTVEGVDGSNPLTVSESGDVMVGGSNVYRISSEISGVFGESIDFASGITISDANLDALNGGEGNYGGASVTVERAEGANAADTFAFAAANGYTVDGNSVMKDGRTIATFTNAEGKLVITFAEGATTAEANAVVRQWSYRNDGGSSTALTLAVVANDGQGESGLDSQIIGIPILLGVNTAPTLDATVDGSPKYESAGEEVSLFSQALVNTGGVGQSLTELELTIGGLADVSSAEYLMVDGTKIDLSQSATGTTANGYTYAYTLAGSTATLTISSAQGMNTTAMIGLVNGLAYGNTSATAMSGTRTFTISGLTDNGGTANGGADTSNPGLTSSVILAVNNAPTVGVDTGDTDTDPGLLYNDGSLTGFTDYVNEVDISADGKTVIVCGSSGTMGSGDSTLYVYSRDTETGALTLMQTFTQSEAAGLNKIGSAAISSDGTRVYVSGYDGETTSSIVLFTRDIDTGELSYQGVVDTLTVTKTPWSTLATELVLSDDGKSLYVFSGKAHNHGSTNNHDIDTYTINSDGTLNHVATYTGGSAELGVNNPTSLTISPDGEFVYVSNYSSSCIGIFSRDTETGELIFRASVNSTNVNVAEGDTVQNNAFSNVVDIVITADGQYLYASTFSSALVSVFSLGDDGMLTYVQSFDTWNAGSVMYLREMALSPDGSTLYVGAYGSNNLIICSIDSETGELSLSDTVNMNSQTSHLAVSPDGSNIYIGGYLVTSGLQTASLLPVVTLDRSGAEVVIGSGIHFADADFDAAGDYQGTILTLERTSGANAADSFGFQDGNDLTMSGGVIRHNGIEIATFTDTGGSLTIAFTSSVTKEVANQVARQITYKGTGADLRMDMTLTVSDGSKSAQASIALIYANNAPVVDSGDTLADAITGHEYTHILPEGLFSDPDGDELTWTVTGLPTGLTYDAETRTISGTPTTAGSVAVRVTATDSFGAKASITLTLDVTENSAPELANPDFALPDGRTGHEYAQDLSGLFTDADGDSFTVSVEDLPSGLSYDEATGVISGSPTTAGTYTVRISADDGHGGVTEQSVVLEITGNTAPIVSLPGYALPAGKEGTDYACTLPEGLFTDAEGDALTWEVSGLPDDLSFDAVTRTIAGTAPASGSQEITVTVTDSEGASSQLVLTLTVAENNVPELALPDFSLDQASHGQEYRMVLPEGLFSDADGDPLTINVTDLPDGLDFDASTRTISGVPTTGGVFTVTISASDNFGGTVEHAFSLEVATPPSLTADASGGTVSIAADGTVSGNDVDLFDNVAVGLDVNGEELTTLVVTVGTSGANHALVIDGHEIGLTATGGGATTAANGYGYKVEIVGGKAVVTIDLAGAASADVQTLVDGMAYRVAESQMGSGSVTVTLTSLSDASAHPAALNIASTVVIDSAIVLVEDLPSPGDTAKPDIPGSAEGDFTGGGFDSVPAGDGGSGWNTPVRVNFASQGANGADSALNMLDAMISGEPSSFDTGAGVFDAPALEEGVGLNDAFAPLASVHGTWVYDVAGNRHIFSLPDPQRLGINAPIVSYRLVWADTGEMVQGMRLDTARWSLIAAGFRNPGQARVMVLIETERGEQLRLPVEVSPLSVRPVRDAEAAAEPTAKEGGSPVAPMSQQGGGRIGASFREDGHMVLSSGLVLPGGKPSLAEQLNRSLGQTLVLPIPTISGNTSAGESAARMELAAANQPTNL
ncbi:beta-propeller fold lactonase family protein [Pseudodesulfovibrio sp. F-1]|uniref:Beta-propeller fold lactonase family protein n=1 Tax=Pseudodesulfovibrio alkaliphilus TaxID=2661613 RepID=A0A7K1KR03_9BACT|nr:putative Ig domain-containing protein [Pseudodesulfovibrio alkaliphilus]MUM78526.1 beta-propeller fold lactonase family protein [Pseudodesulfovibrio alkaliphilus]